MDDEARDTALAPLSDAAWPPEIDDLREGFAGQLNVYRTMAHHPALLRAWAPLRQHIVRENALGPEQLEIVILRAAFRIGSDYEWNQHVYRARAIGIADARILALRGNPEGEDALLVQAVDSLFAEQRLPPAMEAALAARHGRRAVFDLLATIGFYTTLGFILKTYETPLDEAVAASLAAQPLQREV